jgi:hypothetical protein
VFLTETDRSSAANWPRLVKRSLQATLTHVHRFQRPKTKACAAPAAFPLWDSPRGPWRTLRFLNATLCYRETDVNEHHLIPKQEDRQVLRGARGQTTYHRRRGQRWGKNGHALGENDPFAAPENHGSIRFKPIDLKFRDKQFCSKCMLGCP